MTLGPYGLDLIMASAGRMWNGCCLISLRQHTLKLGVSSTSARLNSIPREKSEKIGNVVLWRISFLFFFSNRVKSLSLSHTLFHEQGCQDPWPWYGRTWNHSGSHFATSRQAVCCCDDTPSHSCVAHKTIELEIPRLIMHARILYQRCAHLEQ